MFRLRALKSSAATKEALSWNLPARRGLSFVGNMAGLPYFPFYPADWISSPRIMCLTLAQQGAYMRLLCALWMSKDCSIPDDTRSLSMITGLPVEEVNCLGPFLGPFPGKTGFITNERLLKEWEKAHWLSSMRSKAGKKSGKVRRTSVKHEYEHTDEHNVNKTRNDVHKSEVRSQSHNSESEIRSQKSEVRDKKEVDAVQVSRKPSPPASDEEWLAGLRTNPTYAGLDVDRELGKCQTWCETNRKSFSRRRFVNWINRAERPMQAHVDSPFQRGVNDFLRRHGGEHDE